MSNVEVEGYVSREDAQTATENVRRWRSRPGRIEYRDDRYHTLPEATVLGMEMIYLAFCRYCGVDEIKTISAFGVAAAAVADGKVPLPLVDAALLTGLLNHGTISSIKVHYYEKLGAEARRYMDWYAPQGQYLDGLCHISPSPWNEK